MIRIVIKGSDLESRCWVAKGNTSYALAAAPGEVGENPAERSSAFWAHEDHANVWTSMPALRRLVTYVKNNICKHRGDDKFLDALEVVKPDGMTRIPLREFIARRAQIGPVRRS